MSKTYTCAHCGEKCLSNWEDADAVAEYEKVFGLKFDRSKVAELCDDCYQRLRKMEEWS